MAFCNRPVTALATGGPEAQWNVAYFINIFHFIVSVVDLGVFCEYKPY